MRKFLKTDNELDAVSSRINYYSKYKDYTLVTENDALYDNDLSIIYSLDTRVNNYNHSVNDDFWNFYYNDMKMYIDELNKDDYFSVLHRKGKNFIIVENYKVYNYNDDDTLTYILHDNKAKRETLKKIIDSLESNLLDNEIKGIIHNELNIGGYNDCHITPDYYTSLNFNNDLLSRLYEDDLYECSNNIIDHIKWDDKKDNKTLVYDAYKSLLHKHYEDKLSNNKKYNALLDYNMAIA